MIKLLRVDHRLLHGQVAFSWKNAVEADCILIACDAVMKDESMIDEETLEQLCENSRVMRYDLKSVPFHLEGIKIPAFIGKITIKLTGTQTLANFAHLLLQFGTYSGIGIKTAIGMGAVKILDEGRRRE